jgi:hypothetical protein
MASLSKVTDGELTEFKRILSELGLTAEAVRRIIRNPNIAGQVLASLQPYVGPEPKVVADTRKVLRHVFETGRFGLRSTWVCEEQVRYESGSEYFTVGVSLELRSPWKTVTFLERKTCFRPWGRILDDGKGIVFGESYVLEHHSRGLYTQQVNGKTSRY